MRFNHLFGLRWAVFNAGETDYTLPFINNGYIPGVNRFSGTDFGAETTLCAFIGVGLGRKRQGSACP